MTTIKNGYKDGGVVKSRREQNFDWFNEKYGCRNNRMITTFLNEVDRLVEDGMNNQEALGLVFSQLGAVYD